MSKDTCMPPSSLCNLAAAYLPTAYLRSRPFLKFTWRYSTNRVKGKVSLVKKTNYISYVVKLASESCLFSCKYLSAVVHSGIPTSALNCLAIFRHTTGEVLVSSLRCVVTDFKRTNSDLFPIACTSGVCCNARKKVLSTEKVDSSPLFIAS